MQTFFDWKCWWAALDELYPSTKVVADLLATVVMGLQEVVGVLYKVVVTIF
jgi:hypothetical protein